MYLVCRARCSLRVNTIWQSPKPVHWNSFGFGLSRYVFFAAGMEEKIERRWKKEKKGVCACKVRLVPFIAISNSVQERHHIYAMKEPIHRHDASVGTLQAVFLGFSIIFTYILSNFSKDYNTMKKAFFSSIFFLSSSSISLPRFFQTTADAFGTSCSKIGW